MYVCVCIYIYIYIYIERERERERERESHFSKSIFYKDISFFLCFVATLNELKNNL